MPAEEEDTQIISITYCSDGENNDDNGGDQQPQIEIIQEPEEEEAALHVVEHVCSKCLKVYKTLAPLMAHLNICGKQPPKRKAKASRSSKTTTTTKKKKVALERTSAVSKRRSSRRITVTSKGETEAELDNKRKDSGEADDKDVDMLGIVRVSEDEEETCYCCDEPVANDHVR